MKIISVICATVLFISSNNCQENNVSVISTISQLINATEFDYAVNLSQITSQSINEFLTILNDNVFTKPLQDLLQANTVCTHQLRVLSEGIRKNELWALKLIDASAKLQSGLLYGNIFHLGNYDECLEINHQYQNGEDGNIKGQYCTTLVSLGTPNASDSSSAENEVELSPLLMMFGLCVPSGCSAQDLQNISDTISNNYLPQSKMIFTEMFCSTEDSKTAMPIRSIISITIFALIGLVIIVGTFADVYDVWGSCVILKCFSFYSNGKKLLNAKTGEDSLGCLNGIRVLSMMLILLGHRVIMTQGMPAVNRIFVEQWKDKWHSYFFIGLGFPVDTFFTISGLLVVYLYIKATEKGRKISWIMFYTHRLIRLTPSLVMIVLLYATMLQFFEHQPFPFIDRIYGNNCREYWWTTILYIQNYWNPNNMCAVHTWYLAIDTQLYLLAPILLIGLRKFPQGTTLFTLVLTFLSVGGAAEITWSHMLGATFLNQGPEEYKYLYTPTHIRFPAWILGALTGYFIAKNKGKSFPLNKFLVYCLWIISVGSLIFVLLIQQAYHNSEYNVFDSALFNAFARPIWAAAICVITLLCVFGHGGVINSFLSCSIFNVLIRINYSIYLIHMMVTIAIMGKIRAPMYLSEFTIVHEAVGDYALVLVVATVWTLAFESPIIALEKLLSSKGDYGKDKYILSKTANDLNGGCKTVIIK